MKRDDLEKLRIPREQRSSSRGSNAILIFLAIAFILVAAGWFAWPRVSDSSAWSRRLNRTQPTPPLLRPRSLACPTRSKWHLLLTTSGYIINRERIELSPVLWALFAGLERRSDPVKRAKSSSCLMIPSSAHESPRRKVGWPVRKRPFKLPGHASIKTLREQRVESEQQLDDAQAELTAAEAGLREAQGLLDLARWQLAWTVIRSPIDGVVLEKLADENELVSPQSFGGDKGPSTALLAVADPQDLQVEIDLNESDLSKYGWVSPAASHQKPTQSMFMMAT